MKLTLEVSEQICKRISATEGRGSPVSVEQFIKCAIESELRRVECNRALGSGDGNMAALARKVEGLEKGQRAIVALVDSSAAILAELLRGPGVRRRGKIGLGLRRPNPDISGPRPTSRD